MNPPKAVVIALVLAGCGFSRSDLAGPPSDAGGGASGCEVALVPPPMPPIAGPATKIRVSATVTNVLGVFGYDWQVQLGSAAVTVTPAQADNSAIDFDAPVPGAYEVSLTVTSSSSPCSTATLPINVGAPGARSERLRLRVVPLPSTMAPPHEESRTLQGGADADLGIIAVDPGVLSNVQVNGPSGGVPAYLRFSPSGAPDAVVEAFANTLGLVTTQLLPVAHTVLVVPSLTGIAPRRIASWSSSALVVDAGSPVGGLVQGPAGAPLAGATVQLSIDGVPSTVAATTADGSFTVRAVTDGVIKGTSPVLVEVTPPGGSGLPRLSATSTMFDLTVPLQIRYDAGITLKDLAGTHVTRKGAAVANASVMVVGALAAAGTVTAGTAAGATGEVRIATTANAAGALPATLVPSAILSAVVTASAGDLAVVALDTTAAVPASLDAPPMASITATMQGPTAASLPGAVLDLVPSGALAMAAAPVLHVIAGPAGKLTATLAAGGHYDLHLHDPVGRAAPLPLVADQGAATITGTTYHLPVALQIRGKLMLGGTQALPSAAIQILCDACTGIDRARPIAESVSDGAGQFTIAVPDPGTM